MEKILDMLQSISGDLIGARLAIDAEWTDFLAGDNSKQDVNTFNHAVLMLASAQGTLEKARELLEEL